MTVDCRGNLLITQQNECKRKARAKDSSGPHWEAGWIHSFAREKVGRNEDRSAKTVFAQTDIYD